MLWIVVEGLKPYDGRYPFDNSEFSVREWGWIREFTGYLPLTIDDGYDGGDPALHTALAVIMLHRAGRVTTGDAPALWERLADLPALSTFRLDNDEQAQEGADAGPPEGSSTGNGGSSGAASQTSSESSTGQPGDSGTPASATSPSGLVTWPT